MEQVPCSFISTKIGPCTDITVCEAVRAITFAAASSGAGAPAAAPPAAAPGELPPQ